MTADDLQPIGSSEQEQEQNLGDPLQSSLEEPLLLQSSLEEPLPVQEDRSPTQDNNRLSFSCDEVFFKFLFFLSGLSGSTWGRFGIVYYNEIAHLSPRQVGLLQGVTPLVSLVAIPLWGTVADRMQSRKRVYLVCQICSTLFLIAMAFLRPPSFDAIFFCVLGMSGFRASGVLDAHVLDFLGEESQERYGEFRVWTAISWGLGAVVMGYITDYTVGFDWNFGLYGGMMSLMIFMVAWGLPARSKSEQAVYDNHNGGEQTMFSNDGPNVSELASTLCRLPVLFWLSEVIIVGAGMALVDSFLFIYLQNDLKASTHLCGWSVGTTVLCELPIFAYSQLILGKIGHDGLFLIAMAAYIVRAVSYTLLTESTVAMILPLESLHGVTFACMWVASIDYSAKISPPEWATTVQSILSTCFACLGAFGGSLVGGWVMEEYSASTMYRGMAGIIGCVFFFHSAVLTCCRGVGHGPYVKEHQRLRQEQQVDQRNGQPEMALLGEDKESDARDLGEAG